MRLTLKNIIKLINDDSKLKLVFYKPIQLLEYVLCTVESNVSYRMHNKLTKYKTNNTSHHSTIYKFYMNDSKILNMHVDTFIDNVNCEKIIRIYY